MTPLCELALKYGCDKGGDHNKAGEICHVYTPTYHSLFGNLRKSVRRVLEVGVNTGASLRMWEEYFPYAEIIGLDIDRSCLFDEGRIRCYEADQSSQYRLYRGIPAGDAFDLIVDDGSHTPEHQIVTAAALIPFLHEDGVFVTEDIYTEETVRRLSASLEVPHQIVQCPRGRGPHVFTEKLLIARKY